LRRKHGACGGGEEEWKEVLFGVLVILQQYIGLVVPTWAFAVFCTTGIIIKYYYLLDNKGVSLHNSSIRH
jgi:hypothetical protein